MAYLIDDIYTILRDNTFLLSKYSTRIYPTIAPQKVTLPAIVWRVTDIQTTEHKGAAFDYDKVTFTVSNLAITARDAEIDSRLVRTALNRYKGGVGNPSDTVHGIRMLGYRFLFEPDQSYAGTTSGIGVFVVETDWEMQIKQNISE